MVESRSWPIPQPPADGILVHQVSDTHFGYRSWSHAEGDHMTDDLTRVGLIPPVDAFIHTGDITDTATATEDAYAIPWLGTAAKGAPSLWAMGNHDVRTRVPATRAGWETAYGRSANTYLDVKGTRFVTFAPDQNSDPPATPGWYPSATTWAWLDTVISAAPGPVVICTHMPPWEIGGATTVVSDTVQPQARYDHLMADHTNIVGILSGHMHWEISDPLAAQFVTMGGRPLPILMDVSSMLSINDQSRDMSGQYQSYSAYVTLRPDRWEVRYRAHGTHAWTGAGGQRVTTMDLSTGLVTHGMG